MIPEHLFTKAPLKVLNHCDDTWIHKIKTESRVTYSAVNKIVHHFEKNELVILKQVGRKNTVRLTEKGAEARKLMNEIMELII